MKTMLRVSVALLVGVLAFLSTLVVTTELLAPHVWPALLVSLPIAVVAGVAGVGLSLLGLRYREEKAANGQASPRTVARLGGLVVGIVAFVVAGVAATATLGVLAMGLITAMLVGGLPVGTVVGVLAGLLTGRYLGRRRGGAGETGEDGTSTA